MMIMMLLDTNILSEMMKVKSEPRLIAFLDKQPQERLFISTITQAEIELGIALLPKGKRKTGLATIAQQVLQIFATRNLVFGSEAASVYGQLVAEQSKKGRTISVEDAQIAAIALVHDMTVITRNTKDFDNILGLRVLNPWL